MNISLCVNIKRVFAQRKAKFSSLSEDKAEVLKSIDRELTRFLEELIYFATICIKENIFRAEISWAFAFLNCWKIEKKTRLFCLVDIFFFFRRSWFGFQNNCKMELNFIEKIFSKRNEYLDLLLTEEEICKKWCIILLTYRIL